MDEAGLVAAILEQYKLNPLGTHGVSHWARVMEIGLALAEKNGADEAVVRHFALFHDSRRENEGLDFNHGLRGAKLATRMRKKISLDDAQFALLIEACTDHTKGKTRGNLTVCTCWDSDRLDLGRVGTIPDPERLCTDAAKNPETIAWALDRAKQRIIPERVWSVWKLNELRFNNKGLPWLDRVMVGRILERATSGFFGENEKSFDHHDKQTEDFLQTLKTLQHYNYCYRSEQAMELYALVAPFIPEKKNTDIVRMWLALALALKDLYRLRRDTLKTIFAKSRLLQR